MRSKRRSLMLALIIPIAVGIVIGLSVGHILYIRDVERIERTSGLPAHVAVVDLSDVQFGYAALSTLATTLIGLVVGVFWYGLLKEPLC